MKRAWVVVALLAFVGAQPLADQRDPVRGAAPAAAGTAEGGSGSLSGQIVGDSSGRPVRRAIVRLTGSELSRSVSTITDDAGRFRFDGLPAGRFIVTASKPAHLTTAYGARQPGRPGTAVSVPAGQEVGNIVFQLPVGGVITGTVLNFYGEPIPGVSIIAGRPELDRPGAGQSTLLGSVTTDDRGVYRIFGLEPGTYIVGAHIRLGSGPTTMLTDLEVTESLAALQRSAPAPGRSAPASTPPPAPRPHSLAPIFFPRTPDFSAAQPIALALGQERSGVDIVLRAVPAVRISGTVSGPGGEIPAVQIGFASDAIVQLPGYTAAQPQLTQPPDKQGRFTYTGVIPGRYTLTARTTASPPGPTAGGGTGGGVPSTFTPPADALWALASFTVTDADVEGITLLLGRGLQLPGRVAFDATTLTPPASMADIRLSLAPRREGGLNMTNGTLFGTLPPPPATVGEKGAFTFRGLVPGVYQLNSVWGAATGWWLRSAVADGVDILDVPLEIQVDGRLPSSLVVTYSDRQTEVSGVLQTAGGAPAPDYFIIAFSTDSRTWRPQARRLASTRPATDGAFFLRNLPPGDYYLAALTDLDPAQWQTPAFLGQLAPVALKFTLTDGQKLRQDLRVQ